MQNETKLRAWVVSADMGLGHQRATAPFADIAEQGILTANDETVCSDRESRLWKQTQRAYESISRIREVPLVGHLLFGLMDELQKIAPFYPLRDLSHPTYQAKIMSRLVRKGIGHTLVEKLKTRPELPMITSFMLPALAADAAGYDPVFCIICDAEISRAWVAANPAASRIRYLVPCGRAMKRLRSYGVPDERIFLTGFPLPFDLLGGRNLDHLRADLAVRLQMLDPAGRFRPLHGLSVDHFLGTPSGGQEHRRVLTITYAVGGAGAQRTAGREIAESLRSRIGRGEVVLNLVAGVRSDVRDYFEGVKQRILPGSPGLNIVYAEEKKRYFGQFSQLLRTTDILWTKPSELSFYCGLGLPIIMSPPIGSQETFNRKWLMEIQAGIPQEDPRYTDQWLFDLLEEGRLAEAAWSGFLKARKNGTYQIMDILQTGRMARDTSPLKR